MRWKVMSVRHHGSIGDGGRWMRAQRRRGCGDRKPERLATTVVDAEARMQGMESEGEPFGFIGATDAGKPTTCLDLCACHDLPQCLATGHAHAISIRSLGKLTGCFASPNGPRLIAGRRNTDLKASLRHEWAEESTGRPIDGFDNRSRHL